MPRLMPRGVSLLWVWLPAAEVAVGAGAITRCQQHTPGHALPPAVLYAQGLAKLRLLRLMACWKAGHYLHSVHHLVSQLPGSYIFWH